MSALAIIDLGYGNVDSIRLAFARLGVEAELVDDAAGIERAERLVLPGVGAAGFAMARVREAGLVEPLKARTTPLLGICLGMQMMFEQSDEDDAALLGLVPGRVRALEAAAGRPVPNMGWSRIEAAEGVGLEVGDYVYFAHSFACDDGPASIATAQHGRTIPAAIRKNNLLGAQFHPERSAEAGARFLKAFLSC